jgi:hypothetical protein
MKQCSRCHQTYDDDTYKYCLEDGSLLSKVFDVNATLVLNDDDQLEATIVLGDTAESSARVKRPRRKPTTGNTAIKDRVIAICINEQYPHCKTAEELYTATRGIWRLGRDRAGRAKYAFAIYKGEIKEVYEIERWLPATKESTDFWVEKLESQGRTIKPEQRYEFIGHLAPEEIRKKYIGHLIPKRHKGNPIMYFNC